MAFTNVLGCLAMCMNCCGYYALCLWMKEFSATAAAILLISAVLFFIPGTAHHVFCGVAEWFYIRMGMTEEAREAITDFFKKTSITMIVCYLGLIVFSVTLFCLQLRHCCVSTRTARDLRYNVICIDSDGA